MEEQKIPYFTKNEFVQGLFGLGQIGTGPIEIQVSKEYEAQAREIIQDFINSKSEEYFEAEEEPVPSDVKEFNRNLNLSVILGFVLPPLNLYHLSKALKIKNESNEDLKGNFRIGLAAFCSLFGLYVLSLIFGVKDIF